MTCTRVISARPPVMLQSTKRSGTASYPSCTESWKMFHQILCETSWLIQVDCCVSLLKENPPCRVWACRGQQWSLAVTRSKRYGDFLGSLWTAKMIERSFDVVEHESDFFACKKSRESCSSFTIFAKLLQFGGHGNYGRMRGPIVASRCGPLLLPVRPPTRLAKVLGIGKFRNLCARFRRELGPQGISLETEICRGHLHFLSQKRKIMAGCRSTVRAPSCTPAEHQQISL